MTNPWKVDTTGAKQPRITPYGRTAKALTFSLSLAALSLWLFFVRLRAASLTTPPQPTPLDSCPQPAPITPNKHVLVWESLLREAATEEYKNMAVEWLSGAIQIVCVHSW